MSKRTLIDLSERAVATFAQAFLAVITVDATGVTQLSALKVAAVAGAYAVGKFTLFQAQLYLARPPLPPAPEAPAPTADSA